MYLTTVFLLSFSRQFWIFKLNFPGRNHNWIIWKFILGIFLLDCQEYMILVIGYCLSTLSKASRPVWLLWPVIEIMLEYQKLFCFSGFTSALLIILLYLRVGLRSIIMDPFIGCFPMDIKFSILNSPIAYPLLAWQCS